MKDISIAEDVTYHFEKRLKHFASSAFAELTLLQKAARLVEIGIIGVFPQLNQSYFMLENQVELARILLESQAWKDAEKRVRIIENTQPGIYDNRILIALCSLLKADLDFDRGDLSRAFDRYVQAIPEVSDVQGIPARLFDSRIGELLTRIRSIESEETALDWCEKLQTAWIDTHVNERFPEVIVRLQILSDEITEKHVL